MRKLYWVLLGMAFLLTFSGAYVLNKLALKKNFNEQLINLFELSSIKSETLLNSMPLSAAEVSMNAIDKAQKTEPKLEEKKQAEVIQLDIAALLADKLWVVAGKHKNGAHMTIDMQKGQVFGSAGCNKFQGGYKIGQTSLIFNQFIASAKHCVKGMEADKYFLSSLARVQQWQVKDAKLHLYDKNMQLLLQFTHQ